MENIPQPKIYVKDLQTVVCDKCGSSFFHEVFQLKVVPKLMAGNLDDGLVPYPTYMCAKCGHINPEFDLFKKDKKDEDPKDDATER